MKPIVRLCLMAAALALAGCEDVADRLSEPVRRPPPQTATFAADPRSVWQAARGALAAMDYRVTGGGPAEGEIEGMSAIMPGDAPSSTKQVTLRAQFRAGEGEGTEVTVRVTEVAEREGTASSGEAPGPIASASPSGLPIGDVFFRAIQQQLNELQNARTPAH